MPVRFQLVIDCADPDRLARFWAAALGYELEPPPAGFATWDDYWRDAEHAPTPLGKLGAATPCPFTSLPPGPRTISGRSCYRPWPMHRS
jgi:hypothetical protein